MRSILFASFALSAGLAAQGFAVYVPDNQSGVGTCNVIPWGTTSTSATWVNQRYQQLVTASDLNGQPGVVTGLAWAPCATGVHESDMLQITIAHVPLGFDLSLNTNFDDNLNVLGTNATVVLDQENYRWQKTGDQWSSVGLDSFFVYNGVDDLLIDILVMGNNSTGGSSSSSMHRATRQRLYATAWTGTPPLTGIVGNAALKVGVEFGCAGLSTYGVGCDNVTLDLSGSAVLGAMVNVEMSNGAASLPAALNLGTINTTPFPIDLTPFGFTGCTLYNSTDATVGGITSPAGTFQVGFTVPNNVGLIGVRIFTQFVTIKPSAPGGGAASNGGRILFGSGC